MGAGFPGFFGDRRLGGYQQRCCALTAFSSALRTTLAGSHASIVEALEFLGARVEAEIALALS
jgi:hypothetical protein